MDSSYLLRRKFVGAIGAATMGGIAGCSTSDEDNSDNENVEGNITEVKTHADGFGSTMLVVEVDEDIDSIEVIPEDDDEEPQIKFVDEEVTFTVVDAPDEEPESFFGFSVDDVNIEMSPGEYTINALSEDGTTMDSTTHELSREFSITDSFVGDIAAGPQIEIENSGDYPIAFDRYDIEGDRHSTGEEHSPDDYMVETEFDDDTFIWPGSNDIYGPPYWAVEDESNWELPFDEQLETTVTLHTLNGGNIVIENSYTLEGEIEEIGEIHYPSSVSGYDFTVQ